MIVSADSDLFVHDLDRAPASVTYIDRTISLYICIYIYKDELLNVLHHFAASLSKQK